MKNMRRFEGDAVMALTASAVVFFFAVWVVLRHLAPDPPAVQLIANPGDGQVTLEWTNGADYDEEYDVMWWEYQQYQRKRDGDVDRNWNRTLEADPAKRRHRIDIDGLTNGWTYVFRVRARNGKGHGTPSNEAIAVPEAAPEVVVNVPGSKPIVIRLPKPDPAIEEHLVRIEERLAGLLTRANAFDLSVLEAALTELRDRLRLPALDPATKEQLARIEERLTGLLTRANELDLSALTEIEERLTSLLTRANELDLSALKTLLTEIRDQLPPPAGTEQATLLPVHLLLHFRNAQLSEPNGGLSGSGVVLEPLHERMLDATVNTLRECAEPENPVRIRPYGFASSTPFTGRDDTDDLNVMAANRRARAAYKALNERLPDGSLVNVEEPPRWDTFGEMVEVRDGCIESPSEERGRDPFLDRVVVLELQTSGRCAPADWATRTIRCSGSEGSGP